MDPLHRIAERRIEEALAEGEFDDLPGSGEPLALEDLSQVPDDLRASYVLLKGAGVLPEEMELRKSVLALGALIAACTNDTERGELLERRERLALRYALAIESRRG
jgi:hypothetical protein